MGLFSKRRKQMPVLVVDLSSTDDAQAHQDNDPGGEAGDLESHAAQAEALLTGGRGRALDASVSPKVRPGPPDPLGPA
jgi:hypothetical protein